MPTVTVKILRGRSREKLRDTMAGITDVVCTRLNYDPKHVSVYIEEVDHDAFMEAGQTGAEMIEKFGVIEKYQGNWRDI